MPQAGREQNQVPRTHNETDTKAPAVPERERLDSQRAPKSKSTSQDSVLNGRVLFVCVCSRRQSEVKDAVKCSRPLSTRPQRRDPGERTWKESLPCAGLCCFPQGPAGSGASAASQGVSLLPGDRRGGGGGKHLSLHAVRRRLGPDPFASSRLPSAGASPDAKCSAVAAAVKGLPGKVNQQVQPQNKVVFTCRLTQGPALLQWDPIPPGTVPLLSCPRSEPAPGLLSESDGVPPWTRSGF